MLKRKWTPLSPQVRISEALNASPIGLSLLDLQAHEFLSGLSAHAIAINLKILARRGEVADHPSNGFRVFALTPRGKQQLDFHRICRAKLARRLRIEIPPGTYPDAAQVTECHPERGDDGGRLAAQSAEADGLPTPGRFERLENREEAIAKPLTPTAMISRTYLRRIVNRALANQAPLTEDDRTALAAAIQEAA